MDVLGRTDGNRDDEAAEAAVTAGMDRPEMAGHLGAYRARDGSDGAPVHVDLDGPHVALVVGKRGYGKSYTLGVLVEELVAADGVAPVVADPMGAFSTFADGDAAVVERPRVSAAALPPRAWCDLLGLSRDGSVGALVWRAAGEAPSLAEMREWLSGADADRATRRAAANHLALAESWGVFAPDGLTASELLSGAGTVLDCSGYDGPAMNAVVRAAASALYEACVADDGRKSSGGRQARRGPLPWLLVDEAHAFFDGVAAPALRTIVTRGRHPGVSLVAATQRPAALPDVAVSQADLLVAHRLTSRADLDALGSARPTYLNASLAGRMPGNPGEAVVVDDATESVHTIRIREREVPHGGGSPRASEGRATRETSNE